MTHVRLLLANLGRKPARTGLTLASLTVAFLLFGLLEPVRAFFEGEHTDADRLVVMPKHSMTDFLPQRYAERIETLPGVTGAAHRTWFGGTFRDPANNFPRWAVQPAAFLEMNSNVLLTPAEREAFIGTPSSAIVGRDIAARYDLAAGDKIPLVADIWPGENGRTWTFDLVGIYDGADDRVDTAQMYINYAFFDANRAWGEGLVSYILVAIDDSGAAGAIAKSVDALFANSSAETATATEDAVRLRFAAVLGDVGAMVTAILAAVLFTILLLAGTTMAQAVRERLPELAVQKTLGFDDRRVFLLVLGEAALLTVSAAAIGLAAAAVLIGFAAEAAPMLRTVRLDARVVLEGFAIALLLGVAVGAGPARAAARLNVVDALARP